MSAENQAKHPSGPAQSQPRTDHAEAQDAVSEKPTLTVKDALDYLDQIKAQTSEQPDLYAAFLETMSGFRSGRLDMQTVSSRVYDLFRGHPALIEGFKVFLPAGYQIETATHPEPDPPVLAAPVVAATQDEGNTESAVIGESGHMAMSKL
ncbi:PAH2 domain-containing protein [Cubamyces sp. BRFM 1775]|nr:PAH2 domain-containing protein [Cubamyces sp. BRFM 1775]